MSAPLLLLTALSLFGLVVSRTDNISISTECVECCLPSSKRLLWHPNIKVDAFSEAWKRLQPTDKILNRYSDVNVTVHTQFPFLQPWWDTLPAWRFFSAFDFADWFKKRSVVGLSRVLTVSAHDKFPELDFLSKQGTNALAVTAVHMQDSEGSLVEDKLHQLRKESYNLILAIDVMHRHHDPFMFLTQLRDLISSSNGWVFVTARQVDIIKMPYHFLHYTPMGLVAILLSAGFEVLELGQFGSWVHEEAILRNLEESDIPISRLLQHSGKVRNSAPRPDVVWALARKKDSLASAVPRADGRMILHPCLTPRRIQSLWERIKPNHSYFSMYRDIVPFIRQDPALHWILQSFWDGHEFSRILCLLDFHRFSKKYGFDHVNTALVTSDDPEWRFVQSKRTVRYVYEPKTGFGNLHKIAASDVPDSSIELAIISQTAEHLFDPLLCLVELHETLQEGGWLFMSMPTLNMQHMTPFHFFHHTPMGIAVSMERAGFEVVEVGQFGNWRYEQAILKSLDWPDHHCCISPSGVLSIDPRRPDQVWILARRKRAAGT